MIVIDGNGYVSNATVIHTEVERSRERQGHSETGCSCGKHTICLNVGSFFGRLDPMMEHRLTISIPNATHTSRSAKERIHIPENYCKKILANLLQTQYPWNILALIAFQ